MATDHRAQQAVASNGQDNRHTTMLLVLDTGLTQLPWQEMPFLRGIAGRTGAGQPTGSGGRPRPQTRRMTDLGAFLYDPDDRSTRWGVLDPRRLRERLRRLQVPFQSGLRQLGHWVDRAVGPLPAPHRSLPEDPVGPPPDPRPSAAALSDLVEKARMHGRICLDLPGATDGAPGGAQDAAVRQLRDGDGVDLFVVRLGPDAASRRNGAPHLLRDLDEQVAAIHAALTARYRSWDLIICHDGAQEEVDLAGHLAASGAAPGKDHVVHIMGDLAMVWYRTAKGRRAIERDLRQLPRCRPLDETERERRGIPLDRRFGDRVLAAEPGFCFRPSSGRAAESAGSNGRSRSGVPWQQVAHVTSNGDTPAPPGSEAPEDLLGRILDLIGVPRDDQRPPSVTQGAWNDGLYRA